MKTEVQPINSYSKKLIVNISGDELKPVQERITRKYQKQSNIPGFRRGKAPLSIIKQRHGASILQDLVEEAIREFYGKAIDESGLQPVSHGKISKLDFDKLEDGMTLEIEVEVEPEIELKKYKGLKVEKDVVEVSEQMIEDNLKYLQEQFATSREVEQAEKGHFIQFDVQELGEGNVPVVGRKYENMQVQLGSGKFDPQIEEQLIGAKLSEKRIVTKESPSPAPDQEKPAADTRLEIHIKKIEEKDFPELNDEFVKNLDDDSLENMEQLRSRLKENISADLTYRSNQAFTNRLVDELLKENPFEVPPSMVDHYLEEMIQDMKRQAGDKDMDEETLRKQYRASAIHHLRWYFLRKKIMETENLSITNGDAEQFIESAPWGDEEKAKAKKDEHYLRHLKEDLLEKKIVDILKQNAEVIEVFPMQERE